MLYCKTRYRGNTKRHVISRDTVNRGPVNRGRENRGPVNPGITVLQFVTLDIVICIILKIINVNYFMVV